MALPAPLPDDPRKWDGWNKYRSQNFYERLCLDWELSPSNQQIEDNCRQLLVWWQKKLPLKNQPSNPIAQLLRGGLDEAPMFLTQARSKLLDPEIREQIDAALGETKHSERILEIQKYLEFSAGGGRLTLEAHNNLIGLGRELGIPTLEVDAMIVQFQVERGFHVETEAEKTRENLPPEPKAVPVPPVQTPLIPAMTGGGFSVSQSVTAEEELLRMLRMAQMEDTISQEQHQAFIGIGKTLGLSEEQAEKIIEHYGDELIFGPGGMPKAKERKVTRGIPGGANAAPEVVLTQAEERLRFQAFTNSERMEMLFIPSGAFTMGSDAPGAAVNEKPLTRVQVQRFFIARMPVTNADYERFDATHKLKRAPWADGRHPVVYVNYQDALRYCQWLSKRDNRKYRLPTEAEWEYAARSTDGRIFPWGNELTSGDLCNFADANSKFPWSNADINCGFAETSPVGSFVRGASPFGVLDLAGNVNEWCLDFFDTYKGGEHRNPKGPGNGTKRVCRGGSWRSRISSCRATARAFNTPDYSYNDQGFRVLAECEKITQ